jgi:hypothetical protein
MKGSRRSYRKMATVLAACAAAAASTVACASGTAAPSTAPPPGSPGATAQRAATENWLAATNQMWTRNDFAALDQVTTGEARQVYLVEQRGAAGSSLSGRTPFRLTGLSVTVPCQVGATTFVAYADTNVFTLGQSMQSVAMVFQRQGGAWKLATVVNNNSGGWPALCRSGVAPTASPSGVPAPDALPSASYLADLTRVLDGAATGAVSTRESVAPFALNSWFTGPNSMNTQFATESEQDRAGGVTLTVRFTAAEGQPIALPLANGTGFWLVGVLDQTSVYHSAAGSTKAAWPDGNAISSSRPAVVHRETYTFITTYTAIDPPQAASTRVTLDGFFGWQLTDAAS